MFIKIYDYSNKVKKLDVPDKDISGIYVSILSGDETGYIKFSDGSKFYFDASDNRLMSFYDGSYDVDGENIQKWINYIPKKGKTISYERQRQFDEDY